MTGPRNEREAVPEDYLAGRTYEEQQKILDADRAWRGVPFPRVYIQRIQLGPKEWGNQLMQTVALEELNKPRPDDEPDAPLIVSVCEHAGWVLSFALVGDLMQCIGSANDAAVFPPVVEGFRNRFRMCRDIVYKPVIRRP